MRRCLSDGGLAKWVFLDRREERPASKEQTIPRQIVVWIFCIAFLSSITYDLFISTFMLFSRLSHAFDLFTLSRYHPSNFKHNPIHASS